MAVVAPEGTVEAPKQDHEVGVARNFFDKLRRKVPQCRSPGSYPFRVIAAHESPKVYDRPSDEIRPDDVDRITI